jgi:hypothetical protein
MQSTSTNQPVGKNEKLRNRKPNEGSKSQKNSKPERRSLNGKTMYKILNKLRNYIQPLLFKMNIFRINNGNSGHPCGGGLFSKSITNLIPFPRNPLIIKKGFPLQYIRNELRTRIQKQISRHVFPI